jgi:hypothetical protein
MTTSWAVDGEHRANPFRVSSQRNYNFADAWGDGLSLIVGLVVGLLLAPLTVGESKMRPESNVRRPRHKICTKFWRGHVARNIIYGQNQQFEAHFNHNSTEKSPIGVHYS